MILTLLFVIYSVIRQRRMRLFRNSQIPNNNIFNYNLLNEIKEVSIL